MSTLLDTNLLTRAAQPGHAQHQTAVDAVAALRRQGEVLCLVPQTLYEFWVVGTRPVAQNGLGLSPAVAQAELSRLKGLFTLLEETAAVLPQWEQLVTLYQVIGKNGHDAHLVAAMMVHGIGRILTFNVVDFQRYQGIIVLDPMHVVASLPPPP
jgi:predicted nucleic acid-binding protein